MKKMEKVLNDHTLICWVKLNKDNYYNSYDEWLEKHKIDKTIIELYQKKTSERPKGKIYKVIKAETHTRNRWPLVLGINDKNVRLMNLEDTELFCVIKRF